MSRVAYVNGRYTPMAAAGVHIEDRGFQFADGVYEVWAVFGGRLADADGHFARLDRSLAELRIAAPMGRAALTIVLHETLRRNRIRDGFVYLQVTRGVARRDHAFPSPAVKPTVVVTARAVDYAVADARAAQGMAVVSVPDIRWGRCDIKTVGLLPNALAKQAAREAGAQEALLVDREGFVTEGASTNVWIVDQTGALRTRGDEANILRGITRASVIALLKEENLALSHVPFTVAEAQGAREVFITAAGTLVAPVISIDGVKVGEGRPGPVATRLRRLYMQQARLTAI